MRTHFGGSGKQATQSSGSAKENVPEKGSVLGKRKLPKTLAVNQQAQAPAAKLPALDLCKVI
jgi:hypothetical protein